MSRAHLLILLTTAALGVVLAVAGSTPASPLVYIRECPEPHDSEAKGLNQLDQLTNRTDRIPEYNDCQRFIVNGKFDSLYAIYATHPRTVLVSPNVGVLVAIIRSFEGTYGQLGIRPGYSCVYLSGDRTRAKVVSTTDSTADRCCPFTDFERLGGTLLESRARRTSGFETDSDYPQVARWDLDPVNRVQYMGVKCEAAWCEIGPKGFQSSPSWTPDPSLPVRMRRNIAIKAWYDEQLVADAPASPGGFPLVSGVRGTIFPAESLADYTDATWKGHWRVVAYIALARPIGKYLSKMNLAGTPWAQPGKPLHPDSLNRVEICVGLSSECEVPPSVSSSCPTVAYDTSSTNWGWARITRAGTTIAKIMCLRRWSNAGIAAFLPGASRWRWVSTDETSWTKCSAGCCEVH